MTARLGCVAGLNALAGSPLDRQGLLEVVAALEGHPDNVAAALYGSAVVAWQEDQHGKSVAQAISLNVDIRIRAIAFIPSTAVATTKARKMLPESIPHRDAARNSANSALLVHALTLRPDLLFRATEDFLHQSYRAEAMPASFALLTKLRAAGVAAFISGAGPTVLALHTGTESDVAELIRGKANKLKGAPNDLQLLMSNLPSGYHREMQLTKELLMPAIDEILDCLQITQFMMEEIKVKKNILNDPKYDLLYSVEEVNKLVLAGIPFREAYQAVGKKIESGEFGGISKELNHSHLGSIGNLGLAEIQDQKEIAWKRFGFDKVNKAIAALIS